MPDPEIDRIVSALLARQYVAISREQAIEAGLTERMIRYRVETGRWRRLTSGVYAATSSAATWHQLLAAAVLEHPRSLVSGRSAAVLHRLPGFRPTKPELTVPADGDNRSGIARIARSAYFADLGRTRVAGFHVVTPAETILNVAQVVPPERLERLIDETLATRAATISEYQAIIDRSEGGRVRGMGSLRGAIRDRQADAYEPPRSELERLSRRLMNDPRVPEATHQHHLLGNAGPMIVDTFIDAWLLIVEVDGRNHHARRAGFERDRRRDNAAAALGLVTLRFTWSMLRQDFRYCLETLVRAGQARARLLA